MFKSIRFRLLFSYAGIALFTSLALGGVLLLVLRGYYSQIELNYLEQNAVGMSSSLVYMIENGATADALQAQIDSMAFFSQTKILLLDKDGKELAKADLPPHAQVAIRTISLTPKLTTANSEPVTIFYMEQDKGEALPLSETIVIPRTEIENPNLSQTTASFVVTDLQQEPGYSLSIGSSDRVLISNTHLGITLDNEPPSPSSYSNQSVKQALYDSNNQLTGYIILSAGPAYGNEVLASVKQGWLLAGLAAVGLAALAGWFVSRAMIAPLLNLTTVTGHMAEGNLSIRADTGRSDEFGQLAITFNNMASSVQGTIETLKQFAADAAHELQTPLTALNADLELLAGFPTAENKQAELLARIQGQVERLKRLVNGLLQLSRLESNRNEVTFEIIDLNELINTMIEPLAARAEQARIKLDVIIPEKSCFVTGNPDQLRRVLNNLLDNAIKFTPGDGNVTLIVTPSVENVSICVEDSGIGIPEDDLPLLFKRFHRGRNASAYPGSGLGLAIVDTIIAQHGGQVSAENTSSGARVCFLLPLRNNA